MDIGPIIFVLLKMGKLCWVFCSADGRLWKPHCTLLLQWSEMGILGPIMMRMLLLSHWVLHRRQVFAHVWNQATRLTYFWSVKEWELFRLIYDNFKISRTFWWICLSFSSWWWHCKTITQSIHDRKESSRHFWVGHPHHYFLLLFDLNDMTHPQKKEAHT